MNWYQRNNHPRVIFLAVISFACGYLISLGSMSLLAQGQCVLPALPSQPGASALDQLAQKAFTEIDMPTCTDQAIADFTAMSTFQGAPADTVATATGALEYLGAVKSWEKGDIPSAILQVHHVLATRLQTSLQTRSMTMLLNLVGNNPSSPDWDLLTQKLEEATTYEVYDGYALRAMETLAMHDLALKNTTQGLTRIRNYLAKPLPMQDRYEAKIVLLEYLVTARDFDDAQMVTVDVDHDLGPKLLAVEWRVRFLQASVAAWSASATPDGHARLARYQQGLAAAQGELQ